VLTAPETSDARHRYSFPATRANPDDGHLFSSLHHRNPRISSGGYAGRLNDLGSEQFPERPNLLVERS
jgi:hypothetical protein